MKRHAILALVLLVAANGPSFGQEQDDFDAEVVNRAARAAQAKLVERELARRDAMIADLKAQLAKEQKEREQQEQRADDEAAKWRDTYDKLAKEYVEVREKAAEQRDELVEMLKALDRRVQDLSKRAEHLERWQVDGRLTSFDPKTGLGVVPLGSEHGARPRMRFLAARAVLRKYDLGTFEVVRVLGPATSEVRLMPAAEGKEPADAETLLAADLHAPWWTPGKKTTIALLGELETGNHSTDGGRNPGMMQFLRSQGAESYELLSDLDGERLADLEPSVRLVVVGDVDGSSVIAFENQKRYREAASELRREADARGIPVVSEKQFLEWTGGPPSTLTEEEVEALREEQIRRLIELRKQLDADPQPRDE